MKSLKKQRGFLGALAGVAGAWLASEGQEDTNESNRGINSAQMAFNQAEARENRAFNQYEADQSRRWQEAMASTSYQRAMNDMDAAGLNPMLAFHKGGAPTPSGATGSGNAGNAGSQIPMQNVAQAGINGAMAAANIQNIASQTSVNEAQATKIKAETEQAVANTGNISQQTENLKEQIPKIKAEIDEINTRSGLNISNQTLNGYKYELTKVQTNLESGRINLTQAQTQVQHVLNQLQKYDLPKAKGEAAYYDKAGGVSPALKDLGAIINGAGAMRRGARPTVTDTIPQKPLNHPDYRTWDKQK